MALQRWIYKGTIKKHLIELNHSSESGKLMVKLNGEVMFYDYGVTVHNKSYFLIIDGMLCSVNAIKKRKKYKYELIEEEITSGKKIQSKEDKQKKYLYTAFAAFILIFIIAVFSIVNLNKGGNSLINDGMATTAQITALDNNDGISNKIYYNYYVKGEKFSGYHELSAGERHLTPFGMPLATGDKFEVKYDKDAPDKHILNINKPTEAQIAKYKAAIAVAMAQTKMLEGIAEHDVINYCNCIADVVYNKYGNKGLTAFYYKYYGISEDDNVQDKRFVNFTKNTYFFSEEINCRKIHLFHNRLADTEKNERNDK